MTQLFSNNADTTLAATLAIGGTSATLTNGSGLSAPTGGDYELLTLVALGNIEIVRATARSGNVVTITRAQEGTTAREWAAGTRVYAGITAQTLRDLAPLDLTSLDPVQIGDSSTAGAASATVVGVQAVSTSGTWSTAVGGKATTGTSSSATAVGDSAECSANFATALGYRAAASGANSAALGADAAASGVSSTALGRDTVAAGEDAVAAGRKAEANAIGAAAFGYFCVADGDYSVAFVQGATAHNYTLNAGALPAAVYASGNWGNDYAFAGNSTMESVILSDVVNLKSTGTITCPVLEGGVRFYADEVGVIIESASGVTGQPELSFGITGNNTKLLAATATTGLDAARKRQRFQTLLSHDGETSYTATVATAATGTTLTGRVYWRGFAVQDEPA